MNTRAILLLCTIFLFSFLSTHAQTFYSQGTSGFSTLSNWNSDPGGAGSNPVAGDLVDGTNTFVIQDGHTITLDQDIDVAGITVGGGTSGILTIGNDTNPRAAIVQGPLSVSAGGTLNTGAFAATHTMN